MDHPLPDAAESGFANASSYDKHRPSYPPEAVDQLVSALKLNGQRGAKIIDLAAGTGKSTELLAQREEQFEILAVEPHNGMRRELERKNLPNVTTKEGTATKIPAEAQSADGLIAAQSFHWFANKEALEEIHRVMRPGGVFGMIWNIEDYNAPKSWNPDTEWEEKVKTLTWSFDDDNPRFRHEKWKAVFDDQLKATPFTIQAADPLYSLPLGESSIKFTYWLTKEAIWARYCTLSQIAVLKGEELKRVKKEVFDAIEGEDVEVNDKGEVALHGYTFLAWTNTIPTAPLKSE